MHRLCGSVYAGKLLLTIAVTRWLREDGLGVDVCSAGELAIALAGGVEKARIITHGNAKSQELPVDLTADLLARDLG